MLGGKFATGEFRARVAGALRLPGVHAGISARRRVCLPLTFILVFFCPFASIHGAPDEPRPINEVKAAFIYQFTKFISWPDACFETKNSPFVICVIGNDDIVKHLRATVEGKKANDHKYEVVHLKDVKEGPKCHIVFMATSSNPNDRGWANRYEAPGTLTICSSERFTRNGGIMRLFEDDNTLKMEINVDAAKRAKLKISSKLLNLVEIVRDKENEKYSK